MPIWGNSVFSLYSPAVANGNRSKEWSFQEGVWHIQGTTILAGPHGGHWCWTAAETEDICQIQITKSLKARVKGLDFSQEHRGNCWKVLNTSHVVVFGGFFFFFLLWYGGWIKHGILFILTPLIPARTPGKDIVYAQQVWAGRLHMLLLWELMK